MHYNQNGDLSGIYSWPVIIFAFFVFWPVGLYLVIKKVSLDRKAAMTTGGKGLKALGIILTAIGALGVIALVSAPEGIDIAATALAGFMLLGGILLLLRANKISKDAKNIKKYLMIIVNSGERKIDTIASAMGKGFDDTKKDIENMINKGFLKNAYIDESKREVVLPSSKNVASNVTPSINSTPVFNAATPTSTSTSSYNRTAQAAQIITCPCCGANNVVVGPIGECEYCRSPLANHKR